MTVESFLTREFDIRFIDARIIVNEAKVKLGIHGYPTLEQKLELVKESYLIFGERSKTSKDKMRELNSNLESFKFSAVGGSVSGGSVSSSSNDLDNTDGSSSYCGGQSISSIATSSQKHRKKSIFHLGR